MGKISKIFAITLFVLILILVSVQNTQALGPYITLHSTEITETTVSFSWTQPDFFATSYTLYISTASNYADGHPFTSIWSTSDRQQTTTTITNLTPGSDYYFYVIASGGGGGVSSNNLEVQTLPDPTPQSNSATNNSAPAIEWQKTYGSDMVVESSNLIQTSDGGYAFMDLGYTYQVWLTPATVFKVDSKGYQQWNKTIAQFIGSSIIQTNDKGYEITGTWYLPHGASAVTSTLIKMDSLGNIQWIQNYTTPPDLGVNHTTYTSFNQIGGNASTSDKGSIYWNDGNLSKMDSNNSTQWVKTLTYPVIITDTAAPLLLTSVIEASDGAIAALGIAPAGHSTFPTQGKMYLVKLEPFLPIPSPTQLSTPIPTPIPTPLALGSLISQLTIPIIVVAILVVAITSVLLYGRHRKPLSQAEL